MNIDTCSSAKKGTMWTRFLDPGFKLGAADAKSLQSCPTLCNPIPGILQARTLKWVAIPFSSPWKWSCSVVSDPQRPHGLQPSRLLHPWDFPGKNTWVGCHCLLPSLPCTLPFHTVHGFLKARMPKWFAIPFSILPTKICIAKAMIFPVVMYGCESSILKKAEHWRIDDFELWCWRRLLRVPWTARKSN